MLLNNPSKDSTRDSDLILNENNLFRFIARFFNSNDPDFAEELRRTLEKDRKIKLYEKVSFSKLIASALFYISRIYKNLEDSEWHQLNEMHIEKLIKLSKIVLEKEYLEIESQRTRKRSPRNIVLRSLRLVNWHMFKDITINFSSQNLKPKKSHNEEENNLNDSEPNEEHCRNIICFVSRNSEGKSGIHKAIRMAVLGPERFFGDKKLSKKERDEKILKFMNLETCNKAREKGQEHLHMELQIIFDGYRLDNWENPITTFIITRKWFVNIPKDGKKMSIYDYLEDFQIESPREIIHSRSLEKIEFMEWFGRYIPEPLQDLILSDRNFLLKSLVDEQSSFIKTITERSSELNRFKKLEDTLKKINQKIREQKDQWDEQNSRKGMRELQRLRQEKKDLIKEIERLEKKKISNTKRIEKLQDEISNIRETTKDMDASMAQEYFNVYDSFNTLNKKITAILEKLNKKTIKIFFPKILSENLDLSTLRERIREIKRSLKPVDENPNFCTINGYYDILRRAIEIDQCICGRSLEKTIRDQFEAEVGRNVIIAKGEICDSLIKQIDILASIKDDFDDLQTIRDLKREFEEISKKRYPLKRKVEYYERRGFNRNLKSLIRLIKEKESKIKGYLNRNRSIDEQIDDMRNEITKIEEEINQITIESNDPNLKKELDEFNKKIDFVEITSRVLRTLKKRYVRELQLIVQNLLTKYFKEIDWENRFWSGFRIDEDWNIRFIDIHNNKISLPSDGQKKIIMLSFIYALLKVYRGRIPLILDNVLAEISDKNIEGFAQQIRKNHFIPQQIFFFTETEWNIIKEYLKPCIRQLFRFEKKSALCSTIKDITEAEGIE